jgi:hypothetical protein
VSIPAPAPTNAEPSTAGREPITNEDVREPSIIFALIFDIAIFKSFLYYLFVDLF